MFTNELLAPAADIEGLARGRAEERLLKAPAVARVLGLGRSKVYEMVAAGELPVVRIGTSVRVPYLKLLEWIEARTVMPTVH